MREVTLKARKGDLVVINKNKVAYRVDPPESSPWVDCLLEAGDALLVVEEGHTQIDGSVVLSGGLLLYLDLSDDEEYHIVSSTK